MYKFQIIFLMFFITFRAYGSHIVGGDLYYEYLGGNQYRFNLTLYRDCNSTGASYDDPLNFTIYNAAGNIVFDLDIPYTGNTIVPIVFDNPCIATPSGVCVQKAVYTKVVTLPPIPGGYTASYQRCCRSQLVNNIYQPDETGLTLTAHIPGSETGSTANTSPKFVNHPPIFLCNNDELVFNHSATEPDGDVLVYSLTTPFAGATSGTPMPTSIPSPPYQPIIWGSGYSANNPLGPGATISIDPNTGVLTADPNLQGLYAFGISVKEYRNGVLISENIRDFIFKVISCDITMQANIPNQAETTGSQSVCEGLSITFENQSYGATNYLWDFGVPGTNTDISTDFEPTFQYPGPGTYEITLICNPGWPCTDTAVQTMTFYDELDASFTTDDDQCLIGNSFDFVGNIYNPGNQIVTYDWEFGNNASLNTANTLNVNNVIFNTSGYIPITFTIDSDNCHETFEDSIYIYPMPNVSFVPPPNYLCEGLTVTLDNTSQNCTYYNWDFGVNGTTADVSTTFEPTYTFSNPGTYTVQLIAGSVGNCVDTSTYSLIMNYPLSVSFTSNDSLCITGNSFNFDGSFIGSNQTTFTWNFGPNASILTANTLDVSNVNFSISGVIPIQLTGNYATCSNTFTKSIYIYPEPTINFSLVPGNHCVPFKAQFIDLCSAAAPLNYLWNFGDDQTSTLSNPSHLYDSVGLFHVSLQIHADVGCVDTLSITKNDFIEVYPSPTANFEVDRKEVSICDADIQFTNTSIGATFYFYMFDDKEGTSVESPLYVYHNEGYFNPVLTVQNEYNCEDTAITTIYVAPFMVYVPNAFTPDGNDYNNIFLPIPSEMPDVWNFQIYNRWGELVFETNEYEVGWDGKFKGKMMPDGVYSYVIQYETCNKVEDVTVKHGHFTLIR